MSHNLAVRKAGWISLVLFCVWLPAVGEEPRWTGFSEKGLSLQGIPRVPYPQEQEARKRPRIETPEPSRKARLLYFSGVLQELRENYMVVGADDGRILDFRLMKRTKFFVDNEEATRPALPRGQELQIEAQQNDDGFLFAVNVRSYNDSPVTGTTDPAPAPSPGSRQDPADEYDPGPPVLKRRGQGEPRSPRASKPSPSAPRSSPTRRYPTPPPLPKANPLIAKAREATRDFAEDLPNFICRQVTSRYFSYTKRPSWESLDVVEADLVYENGEERYQNIRINNEPAKEGEEEQTGTWSTGEYGTTLRLILDPATRAEFRYRRKARVYGILASVYDYHVEKPRSRWKVTVSSQTIFPEYQGSLWIDPRTSRVLRIEMEALNLPRHYPLDILESTVDYNYVRIGGKEYLLPVLSENLSCWRGSSRCSRNKIEFRNYRKFTSESIILHTESKVDFENEGQPAAPTQEGKK